MWNWLVKCHTEGSLTLDDLERIMVDNDYAEQVWKDYVYDSGGVMEMIRDEIEDYLNYLKKNNNK